MAGIRSLVQGGCGDIGGGGGTVVTKFADSYLANQNLTSQWDHRGAMNDSIGIDDLHQQLLTDPSQHYQQQHQMSLHGPSHPTDLLSHIPSSFQTHDGVQSFEDEFISSFQPDQPSAHDPSHHPASIIQSNILYSETPCQLGC